VQAIAPDLRRISFNAFPFGGLFSQLYTVDTNIRFGRDRIDRIKFKQKTIMAENYAGVVRLLSDLASKQNLFTNKKVMLPSALLRKARNFAEHFEGTLAVLFVDLDPCISL